MNRVLAAPRNRLGIWPRWHALIPRLRDAGGWAAAKWIAADFADASKKPSTSRQLVSGECRPLACRIRQLAECTHRSAQLRPEHFTGFAASCRELQASGLRSP